MHTSFIPLACCASLLAGLVQAKLTDQQISSVFPGATELHGTDQTFTKAFDGTFVANSTHLLSVLTVTDGAAIGWLGLGTGSAMVASDTFIMWPYNGQWIISHGVPTGYLTPKDLGSSPSDFSLVSSLSSDTSVAFLRKLQPSYAASGAKITDISLGSQSIIFARSSINPKSSDPDAEKGYHDVTYAAATLDLSPTIAAPAAAQSSTTVAAAASSPATSAEKSPVVASSQSSPQAKSGPAVSPAGAQQPNAASPKNAPKGGSPQAAKPKPPSAAKPSTLRHRPNHHTHVYPRPRSSHGPARQRQKKDDAPASGSGVAAAAANTASTALPSITLLAQSSVGSNQLAASVSSSSQFSIAQSQQSSASSSRTVCLGTVVSVALAMSLVLF